MKDLGLERYLKEFTGHGISNIKDLKTAPELTDELLRDTFRITIPGHRNRIKWAGKYLHLMLSEIIYSFHDSK